MKPPCPKCGFIHTSGDTFAVGRFVETQGYRATHANTPTRATRAEAEADECEWRTPPAVTSLPFPDPQPVPPPPPPPEPKPEPQDFPAAAMETLARAQAWKEFLGQVAFSLTVWKLDPEVRAQCVPVTDWLASCRSELEIMT